MTNARVAFYGDSYTLGVGASSPAHRWSSIVCAERIQVQVSPDLEYLRLALPLPRFIVVEPFWYTDDRPDSLSVVSGWIKAAAAFIDAGYANLAIEMDAALAKLCLLAHV